MLRQVLALRGWLSSWGCCFWKGSAACRFRLHRNDAAARFRRRPAQSDCRQPGDDDDRGADRRPARHVPGTYMAEYGRYNKLTTYIHFINDILLARPGSLSDSSSTKLWSRRWGISPAGRGQFRWRGRGARCVRTTEDMLTLVPDTLREAAASIGLPRSLMIQKVAYRAARAGMVTGVLLAVAQSLARPRRSCSPRLTTSSGASI